MSERIRLFVAATIPDEILLELDAAIADYKANLRGARWAPVENQHVTLKFLGWTEKDSLDDVAAICRRVAAAHEPTKLTLTDLGAFPSVRRARVLWAGIEDPTATLTSIANALDEALGALGFETESRAFTPHLTLARFKVPGRLEELPAPASPPSFPLEDICLFESNLHPRGARYSILERFPLEGEDPPS